MGDVNDGQSVEAEGEIPVLPGAGFIGANLCQRALARGHERFLRIPYRDRDDVGEARKVIDPNWSSQLPRW